MSAKLAGYEHLRTVATAARDFVNSLVGNLATATVDAIEEVESMKADKTEAVTIIIPTTGWSANDEGATYPKYYDIEADAITASDRATVVISPEGQATAIACGMCSTNETLAGKIRLYAQTVPTAAIPVTFWVDQGKES